MKKFSQFDSQTVAATQELSTGINQTSEIIQEELPIDQQAQNYHEQRVQEYVESTQPPPSDIIPDYMLTEPNYVGFQDLDTQLNVYRAASFSLFSADVASVLDVGCGRGDFGEFIYSQLKSDVRYVGVDSNHLMIQAGLKKYETLVNQGNIALYNQLFDQNYTENIRYDWVFHNMNLTIDYGVYPDILRENRRYEYLEQLIRKSLTISNKGVVFMLLNDSNLTDTYLHYSYSGISKILYDMNVRFAIDNTDFPSLFKLVIFNNSF